MRTASDAATLASLVERLRRLTWDAPRRWGTLTPAEMLCHLADAQEFVVGTRVPPGPPPSGVPNHLLKWWALSVPLPWPRGIRTRPGVDPREEGTRPGDFEQDRERAIASLTAIPATDPSGLAPHHSKFGPMTARDWHRWAFLHVDHHLRQFGL